jgi:hypothetical protein
VAKLVVESKGSVGAPSLLQEQVGLHAKPSPGVCPACLFIVTLYYHIFLILQERNRTEDSQTPAQRQAAAKLALRKQLEKTIILFFYLVFMPPA